MTDAGALVVGAGPAGCVAAIVLARAGVRVRLIDRSTFPRDKICGDTLNPGALAILDRLGVGERVRRQGVPIAGMTITGPGGVRVAADYPPEICGLSLCRRDLDALLLESAAAAGASVEAGVSVRAPLLADRDRCVAGARVAASGREHDLSAAVVIAADGRASRLAAALELAAWAPAPRRWAFRAYYQDVDGMTARGEMHIRPGGYIGLAGLPGGGVNVCVVQEMGNRTLAGRMGGPRAIAEATAADPLLRERFAQARQVSAVAALGPLGVDAHAAGCRGLLLAGDAAGFVDPMTGDGLQFALRGGELAAAAALRELETGVPAYRSLARHRMREFGTRWCLNRALRSLVASPRALSLATRLAAVWDAPVRYLVGVAGGVNSLEPCPREPRAGSQPGA